MHNIAPAYSCSEVEVMSQNMCHFTLAHALWVAYVISIKRSKRSLHDLCSIVLHTLLGCQTHLQTLYCPSWLHWSTFKYFCLLQIYILCFACKKNCKRFLHHSQAPSCPWTGLHNRKTVGHWLTWAKLPRSDCVWAFRSAKFRQAHKKK